MPFGKFAVDYEERVNMDRLRNYRKERTRAEMKRAGVGAILTFDPDNIRYITGFYVTTPMRMVEGQCVFFPVNGEPHLVIADLPARHIPRMPWMEGEVAESTLISSSPSSMARIRISVRSRSRASHWRNSRRLSS